MAKRRKEWERQDRPRPIDRDREKFVTAKDVREIVERMMLDAQAYLPRALTLDSLRVSDNFSLGLEDDYAPEQTRMYHEEGYSPSVFRYAEEGHVIAPIWEDHDDLAPDGNVPDAVDTLEAVGGKTFIHLSWTPVLHPHKFQYNVHISATPTFTASDDNKVSVTVGSQVWIRALADGTPLQYNTTYYMQVIPFDLDGEADPSPEVSAALDENGSGDLTVGSITAEQLEAMLILGTTIVAGNMSPGSRVEFGITTHDDEEMVGIHAFDEEDMLTFMVDASDGTVYLYGTVDFGNGSRLLENDIIELFEQPSSGFQTPSRVQSTSASSSAGSSTAAGYWAMGATTAGNMLLIVLHIYDLDGTVPTPDTPANFTLVESQVDSLSDSAMYMYYRPNAPATVGSTVITLNDTCKWQTIASEWSGVGAVVGANTVDETGTDSTIEASITTTTAHSLIVGAGGYANAAAANGSATLWPWEAATPDELTGAVGTMNMTWDLAGSLQNMGLNVSYEVVAATGTYDYARDIAIRTAGGEQGDAVSPPGWTAIVAAFEAKPAGIGEVGYDAGSGKTRLFTIDERESGEVGMYVVSDAGNTRQVGGPTGLVGFWPAADLPAGSLKCDGTVYDIVDYPALAEILGTTYGGNGTTTFGVPNYKGRTLVGLDSGQTEFDTMGETGGSKVPALLAHTHGAGTYIAHANDAANTTATGGSNRLTSLANSGGQTGDITGTSGSTSSGDQTAGNMPPYAVGHWIIFT